jgi:hypothetical protein
MFIVRWFLFPAFLLSVLSASGSEGSAIRSGQFEIVYNGFPDRYAENAARIANEHYERIAGILQHRFQAPVTIILTRSDRQFRDLTGNEIPDWGAAVALGDSCIVVTPLEGLKYNLSHILAHEIVHCVINDAAGNIFVPRWFHEGSAQLLSGEWGIRNELYIVWKVHRNELLTFGGIQDVFSYGSVDAGLAYDQSMLAVRRLVMIHGQRVLSRIINGMENGSDFTESFRKATGLLPSEFEQDYFDYVRKTYGRESLYTFIPGTWTLIMVIAIIVYVIKRRRTRRLMEEWEESETEGKIIRFEDYSENE